MGSEATDAVVWIGMVGMVPREGCELLSPDEGAYVNFLTLASSDSEYRAKVMGALSHYRVRCQIWSSFPIDFCAISISRSSRALQERLGPGVVAAHVCFT